MPSQLSTPFHLPLSPHVHEEEVRDHVATTELTCIPRRPPLLSSDPLFFFFFSSSSSSSQYLPASHATFVFAYFVAIILVIVCVGDAEDTKKNGAESPQNPDCHDTADIPEPCVDIETNNEVAFVKPPQTLNNRRLNAIEEDLGDLKEVRQLGDRRLHKELVAKSQSLKEMEEKFVKVSAELETNVVDAKAKNKALEDILRNKQEVLQRVTAERDAMRKAKCTLALRLQVAEDQLRDVEHKLNSRVLGVEMEKARLSETLEGVRTVTETAEEVIARIQ
ncbi:unnamed protein product [Hydatigera taeniaeformis]|uniref:Uncharacterized protein n=1 Tax=Hydatigena taeniaeformis TaxID=6205 RepID=A0A0R3X8I0_HYDTA|nr:unnamed protein product [Hydatigera taeniaeformis]